MIRLGELTKFIQDHRALFSDGAMGTVLSQRLPAGQSCLDYENLSNPEVIESLHRDYLLAGADMIQTNTFGANRYKLTAHGLEDKLQQINAAGVEIARRAVQESGKPAFIAAAFRAWSKP